MEVLSKVWAENEENAKLCVKCGNAFETDSQKSAPNTETGIRETSFKMDTEEVQDTDSFGIGKVIGLGPGGHSFYLNHRSTQSTANMAQTIVGNDFGDDEVQVYYSKKSNSFNSRVNEDYSQHMEKLMNKMHEIMDVNELGGVDNISITTSSLAID